MLFHPRPLCASRAGSSGSSSLWGLTGDSVPASCRGTGHQWGSGCPTSEPLHPTRQLPLGHKRDLGLAIQECCGAVYEVAGHGGERQAEGDHPAQETESGAESWVPSLGALLCPVGGVQPVSPSARPPHLPAEKQGYSESQSSHSARHLWPVKGVTCVLSPRTGQWEWGIVIGAETEARQQIHSVCSFRRI